MQCLYLFETCRQCRARQSGFAASPSGARTGSTRIGLALQRSPPVLPRANAMRVPCSEAQETFKRHSRDIEMNPANLPFDSEAMLQGLRGWVECESPTWDASAVNRMLDIAAREMAIMGASIERIAGRQGFGGCVRARFPHPKQGEPGILIAGHLDTVHPVGTLEKLAWRREGNKCFGPGIF